MPPTYLSPARPTSTDPDRAGVGLWALTLWTANRMPVLFGIGPHGLGLTPLGLVVHEECLAIGRRFPSVLPDEFAVLPDRVRLLLHVPPSGRLSVGRLVAWLKARVRRRARSMGATGGLWEAGFEGQLLLGPDELAICRRRIRAGTAGLTGPGPDR